MDDCYFPCDVESIGNDAATSVEPSSVSTASLCLWLSSEAAEGVEGAASLSSASPAGTAVVDAYSLDQPLLQPVGGSGVDLQPLPHVNTINSCAVYENSGVDCAADSCDTSLIADIFGPMKTPIVSPVMAGYYPYDTTYTPQYSAAVPGFSLEEPAVPQWLGSAGSTPQPPPHLSTHPPPPPPPHLPPHLSPLTAPHLPVHPAPPSLYPSMSVSVNMNIGFNTVEDSSHHHFHHHHHHHLHPEQQQQQENQQSGLYACSGADNSGSPLHRQPCSADSCASFIAPVNSQFSLSHSSAGGYGAVCPAPFSPLDQRAELDPAYLPNATAISLATDQCRALNCFEGGAYDCHDNDAWLIFNHAKNKDAANLSLDKTNVCRVCGKAYARPSTLKTHMRTHSGERPYICRHCNKSFSQAANLTAHVRTHSGEKPFRCGICDRRFSQSSSVTTHMRTHSGDRPYRCRMCKKSFSDSSTLTKHMRIHSGEKPYQCKVCMLRFSQSGNLNRHMRVHSAQFC